VQGVGFRPFVFDVANRLQIRGFVRNTEAGVEIEAEGSAVDIFLAALRAEAPVLARIAEIEVSDLIPINDETFEIRGSGRRVGDFALAPPDIATCTECFHDTITPRNRRCLYPFTNCTNCGPRYTIIRDVPYDRAATTMYAFRMCENCAAEYHDPKDRRFHAQPNACPICGPQISASAEEVRHWLTLGLAVAVKGIGGYHLVCDASNSDPVCRLRERKRRGDKPFAVMARDLDEAIRLCEVSPQERDLLVSPQRPIVLLRKRPEGDLPFVAPRNPNLGVMLPYTPLHYLLFAGASLRALVMTSGNLSEEPIVSREEGLGRLEDLADRFLTHNRPIRTAVDDSVARVFRGKALVQRRSRGFAPAPIDLGQNVSDVVAAGGRPQEHLLPDDRALRHSQPTHRRPGELRDPALLPRDARAHAAFFRMRPQAVAHDLHPAYLSTRAAEEMKLPCIGVQHHHAHIASCMAEHRLGGPVIGVAFDGTGYVRMAPFGEAK